MLASRLLFFGIASYIYTSSARTINSRNTLLDQTAIEDDVCLTAGCVEAAALLLSNLDESVDPCEDFYRFSCGGWIDQHEIPEDSGSVSVSTELFDDLNLQLKALLESDVHGEEPKFIQIVKTFYDTCRDLASIERAGDEPLKTILMYLGGWPVVEGSKWSEAEFDWIDTLIYLRRIGYSFNSLFSIDVSEDAKDNAHHIIELGDPKLGGMDRTYLLRGLSDPVAAAYFKKMVDAAKLLGADARASEEELLQAFQFEVALANFSLSSEERMDFSKMYNKYTVDELQQLVPKIPWLRYFNRLLSDRIEGNEPLIVLNPGFFIKFADLISRTDKRVVANYMMWKVVDQSLFDLSKSYRDLAEQYVQSIFGTKNKFPWWKLCMEKVKNGLGIAFGSYYVRHYFKEESKAAASEMVTYIFNEFRSILDEIDWMDGRTKNNAREKADAMRAFVGYPDELLNNTALMEVYKDLIFTDTSHFRNIMRLQKWTTDNTFAKLRKPSIKGEWKTHARTANVNAMYYPGENNIEIAAGILQSAFFKSGRPQYMNFAAIGSVIGHETTHGFDTIGRQFDKDGQLVNWWDEATDKLFREKVRCIIDQYDNYTIQGNLKVNGFLTQAENIADNGGLKEAYRAYHSWVKDHGKEPRLPGLKYSQNQLFWISAANIWCSKQRPEVMEFMAIADSHSPAKFRVIGPMSNLPEFSKEFNCPPKAPMNRRNKCRVW